jgi:hypothetical protein
MKEFIEKNPKVVGSILGFVLAGLLSLAGLKMADVCPAAQAVAQPAAVEKPASESK